MDKVRDFTKRIFGDSYVTSGVRTTIPERDESGYSKLVQEEEADAYHAVESVPQAKQKRFAYGNVIYLIFNTAFLVANVAWYVLNLQHAGQPPHAEHKCEMESVDFIPGPMQNSFGYEILRTDIGIGQTSIYSEDSRRADEEWMKISQNGPLGWIRVQGDDLQRINQTSVKLADGSGYIAGIEVFHELHCLNWFRRKVLGRSFDAMEDPMPEYHLPHCLDILRHSIQCHADLSIMPLRWVEDYPFPWPVFQTTRQCRNWDDIMDWTRENSIAASGRVVHPKMGVVEALDWDPEQLPRVGHLKFIDED